MPVNENVKAAWIAALRSGKYSQDENPLPGAGPVPVCPVEHGGMDMKLKTGEISAGSKIAGRYLARMVYLLLTNVLGAQAAAEALATYHVHSGLAAPFTLLSVLTLALSTNSLLYRTKAGS
jgi:hypothetical protein